jgi:hypothetical protein
METPRDFDQFNRLLAGFTHAGDKPDPAVLAALSRVLAGKGQLGVLLEAARQVKRTGFQVGSPTVVHTLLTWAQVKALDAGWARAETEKALKWSRHILEMSALDAHKFVHKRRPVLHFPLHRDPIALTAPLHLAAALAVGHEGGLDLDKQVSLYARQLVHVWPQDKGYKELYPNEALQTLTRLGGVDYVRSARTMYTTMSLALHGLKLASQVVEPELAKHLDAIAARLETDLAADKASFPNGLEEGSMHKRVSGELFDANGAIKFDVKSEAAEAAPAAEEAEKAE